MNLPAPYNEDEAISVTFVSPLAPYKEPPFTNGSGALIYDTLVDNPRTYVTTVGLYNANQDLLAVAKLSKPLPKDFTKELLVRVKLDW